MPELFRASATSVLALAIIIALSFAPIIIMPYVHAEPALALSAGTVRVGLDVSVTGSGFLPTDTSCVFSSPSANLVTSSACVAQGGSVSGSFIVGNVLPGEYVVQVSGNLGDSAQTIIDVSGGAQLALSTAAGPPGLDVTVQGSGFLPTDTTCSISSPSTPNPILPGSGACVIQGGNGMALGSFIIGNVLPGGYVIQLRGNQGDSAQALLEVG